MQIEGTQSCSAPDCTRPTYSRGYCSTHYQRVNKYGKLDTPIRIENLNGRVFNRLTVIGLADKPQGKLYYRWLCRCECGRLRFVGANALKKGNTKSCGCWNVERARTPTVDVLRPVGRRRSYEYVAYSLAKDRCINTHNKQYRNYGGRGIEFRFESFEQFVAELGSKPSQEHSIDRIDVNGHYEPGNVRWATNEQQCRNQRRTVMVTIGGQTQSACDWADLFGVVSGRTATGRIRDGWCGECAVKLPPAPNATGKTCSHRK